MLDSAQVSATDRRPVMALVTWDSGFRAWDPHDSTTGEVWHPRGARALTLSGTPQDLERELIDGLTQHHVSGIILIGRSLDKGTIQIQTRAENRLPGSQERADALGAGVVRSTLTTSEILRDLARENLAARAVSNAENDAGSHLLFRILAQMPHQGATPPVGLVRLPRDMGPEQVQQAIRTVASSVSRHLPALAPAA